MAEFTDEEFVAAVRAIAAERPDYVYTAPEGENCQYAHADGCGCIIGCALNRLGMSLDELSELDSRALAGIRFIGEGLGLSEPTIRWATNVQSDQDNSVPWGEAVSNA